MLPKTLVARTIRSRLWPPCASQAPMIFSFQGFVHEGEAFGLGSERAEVHGAQAKLADLQSAAAEMDVLHGEFLGA
jgi:hypothetical protein